MPTAPEAVNDVFVMNAWGKSSNAGDKVMMLADGNADFSKAVGLTMDGTGYGSDGHIWGGEFLVARYAGFERRGHLRYIDADGLSGVSRVDGVADNVGNIATARAGGAQRAVRRAAGPCRGRAVDARSRTAGLTNVQADLTAQRGITRSPAPAAPDRDRDAVRFLTRVRRRQGR